MPLDFRKEALKHIKRLEAYARKVEQAYEKANKELSRIAVSVNHPVEELFKLKDYPEIKARVDNVIQELHDSIEATILNGEKLEWGYANKVNDTLAKTVTGLTAGEAAESVKFRRYFNQNTSALAAFQKRKESGLNLSQRVWNLTDQYKRDMELGLSVGISDGRSAAQLSRDLRSYLNEPEKLFRRVRNEHGNLVLSKNVASYLPGQGVYRSSYKNALRTARTEINMSYRAADQERWAQMNFVLGYKIARSNNPYLCPVCETLQGDYPKDFIWSGWHPQCRCVRTPILQDMDAFLADEEPKPIEDVPENFKEWVKANQERIEKSRERGTEPYWVKDNKGVIDNMLIARPEAKTPLEIARERHAARTPEQEQLIRDQWNERKATRSPLSDIISEMEAAKVDYYEVNPLQKTLTESEIISRIGGGDLTKGSCSSLAFAYSGNKCGYDVLDFRDGISRQKFASSKTVMDIAEKSGGIITKHTNDFTKAKELLKHTQIGKEYYFTCGSHAAIIRKTTDGYEYLELQSAVKNGFKPLTTSELKDRFGAKRSHSFYGEKYETKACIVEIGSLGKNADFPKLLGYINTNIDGQKKGKFGTIK